MQCVKPSTSDLEKNRKHFVGCEQPAFLRPRKMRKKLILQIQGSGLHSVGWAIQIGVSAQP